MFGWKLAGMARNGTVTDTMFLALGVPLVAFQIVVAIAAAWMAADAFSGKIQGPPYDSDG